MTALQNRLALHRFLCREFGYEDLRAMLDRILDVPEGFAASGERPCIVDTEYVSNIHCERCRL